ncbi:hypothetical protein QTG56_22065 [Rossellomorea sp. AcN35-11]|nr:hypothetical protein [Rossellomorea aquimaris]WJV29564.1 hypothetical protein QTG56_22065 [Rossellomorea sp. AcN35-11]
MEKNMIDVGYYKDSISFEAVGLWEGGTKVGSLKENNLSHPAHDLFHKEGRTL